jgi:hypothetical protein
MSFADLMASDLANTFFNVAEFSESVTYTPSGQSGVARTAVVDRDDETVQYGADGQGREITRTVYLRSDADLGVAAPQALKDSITIDGLAWTVAAKNGPNGGMWRLTVQRHETDEISGGDHRVRR